MNRKSLLYLIMGIFGLALIVSAVVLDGRVPDTVDGTLTGVGCGLFAVGFSLWRVARWEKKDPDRWKKYVVESRDERNVAIRLRAQAVAGEVLQWMLLPVAWGAIFFGAPLWVTMVPLGLFLFKSILEICLMAGYQKKM